MIEDQWQNFLRSYRGSQFSELKQDLFALFATQHKQQGFFVEFGAMDGIRASNTLLLERNYGWTGIMSEPNPRYHTSTPKNRCCRIDLRCVSNTTGDTVKFQCADQSGWPGMVGHIYNESNSRGNVINVETITLNDLLDQHSAPLQVDYISVDTDGSEPMIMQAFDFSRHRATLWTIEHNQMAWRKDICHLMEQNGYVRVLEKFSGYDDWYLEKNIVERL